MSKTLATSRSILRSFLDEKSASDWTDAELNILLNQKYHEVQDMVIETFEDYYLKTGTLNSVVSKEEYSVSDGIPSDIYKLRRVELNYDVTASSGAPTRCLPIHNIDIIRRDLGYANAGLGLKTFGNAFYYSYGSGLNTVIGLLPVPTNPGGSGANAIKIWYVQELPDLVNDTDLLNIPYADRNFMVVVHGAASDALMFGSQDPSGSKIFSDRYESGKMKMQENLESRIAEETKAVEDVSGEILNFDTPY